MQWTLNAECHPSVSQNQCFESIWKPKLPSLWTGPPGGGGAKERPAPCAYDNRWREKGEKNRTPGKECRPLPTAWFCSKKPHSHIRMAGKQTDPAGWPPLNSFPNTKIRSFFLVGCVLNWPGLWRWCFAAGDLHHLHGEGWLVQPTVRPHALSVGGRGDEVGLRVPRVPVRRAQLPHSMTNKKNSKKHTQQNSFKLLKFKFPKYTPLVKVVSPKRCCWSCRETSPEE